MGIRFDTTIGLLVLGVVFFAFGLLRLANDDRFGWLLLGGGALAIYGAWWKRDRPPEA